MRWRPAALVMVAILVATSCNGDDDSASTTVASSTSAPATTTEATAAEATTTAAPSTTVVLTTDPTTTPPATNSDATTTEPTVTATTLPSTTSEPVDERFAVIEAVDAATEASLAILRDPFDDDKFAALEDHFVGRQLTGWKNIVERYREENQKQIENPEEPDAFGVSLASLAVSVDGTSATVQGCEITSGVIVEIGGNPDGTDRVIEDGIARGITELILSKVDGIWKVEQAREPTPDEQIATCP